MQPEDGFMVSRKGPVLQEVCLSVRFRAFESRMIIEL